MTSKGQFHVVVLDDRARFPLHVWRYLSRSVGFGIGDVSLGGDELKGERPLRFETPDGEVSVWWVKTALPASPDSDGRLKRELETVLGYAVSPKRRLFLVDVGGDRLGSDGELWERCFRFLSEVETPARVLMHEQVWLLSSYGAGTRKWKDEPKLFFIRPKNAKTLQSVFKRIWEDVRGDARSTSLGKDLHILVTGAGFEMKNDPDQKPRREPQATVSPLGIRGTNLLLEAAFQRDAWRQVCDAGRPEPKKGPTGYYYPNLKRPKDQARALGHAVNWELDDLWSFLLEAALRTAENNPDVVGLPSNEKKAHLLSLELGLRESFRAALVADDWGHLTHVLDAASLPWHAWWTTNYSHFVDRAVDVLNLKAKEFARSSGTTEDTPLPWRIISIATEARLLMRRRFFKGFKVGDTKRRERFLFKLHGDLAHLSTMAIAGHDKELYTPLALEIDSLHWVYEAAGDWTDGLIRDRNAKNVFWHIVGHDLKDKVLAQTIQGVLSSNGKARHTFLLINPKAESLRDEFLAQKLDCSCWAYNCCADQWLAIMESYFHRKQRMWKPGNELPDSVSVFPRTSP